jgi:hypothetical protein
MKKIIGSLCLIALLYSCKNTTTSTPTSTVNSFIAASKEGDIDEIKKYISRQDISLMEMGEGFLSRVDSNAANEMKQKFATDFKDKVKDTRIDVKDEKIDGNNATVNVEFNHEGKTDTRPFSLVKEDGKWKISLMSTGMNNSGANKEDIEEAMKSINLDSLPASVQKEIGNLNQMDKDSLNKLMKEGMKELEKLKAEQKNN